MSNVILLLRYNVRNEQWNSIDQTRNPSPSARYMHAAILSPDTNSMYLYGGITSNGNTSNQFWKFLFESPGVVSTGSVQLSLKFAYSSALFFV